MLTLIGTMRMPTYPPPVDPIIEMQPQLCDKESATPEPTFPVIVNIHIEIGR